MAEETRKITLSSNDWAYLELYAKAYDWESVLKGLDDSETIAVSETYCAMPVSVVKEITDAWAADATAVGVTPDVSVDSSRYTFVDDVPERD